MAKIKTYDTNRGGAGTVILAGSFTCNGVSAVTAASMANGDSSAVTLIEQAGLLAYRVTLGTGNSHYDAALPGMTMRACAKHAAGVETSCQVDRLVNDIGPAPGQGLPQLNQFDIVVWQAGAGVRTAAVEVSWHIYADERPRQVR